MAHFNQHFRTASGALASMQWNVQLSDATIAVQNKDFSELFTSQPSMDNYNEHVHFLFSSILFLHQLLFCTNRNCHFYIVKVLLKLLSNTEHRKRYNHR